MAVEDSGVTGLGLGLGLVSDAGVGEIDFAIASIIITSVAIIEFKVNSGNAAAFVITKS